MWTGCGKEWGVAGLDGGVAAKGVRMMVAAARWGNKVGIISEVWRGDVCG